MTDSADVAVIGAGAAGLMAAIIAGRAGARVVALDGAKKIGAKILVAGGGRCNVTHDVVDESAYAGSSRHAIRNVLGRFPVPETVQFFREIGVELKREETGKLFPVTDDAHTVLGALLGAARAAGVEIRNPWRVGAVRKEDDAFVIEQLESANPTPALPLRGGRLHASRVIIATGGKALPKSGSDGAGYEFVKAFGHSVTPVFPALVPLTLPSDHWVCGLSGLTVPATIEVRSATGKRLISFTDSTLCAHFGLSGPSVLDISRYFAAARRDGAGIFINWLAGTPEEALDRAIVGAGGVSVARWLTQSAPLGAKVVDHAAIGMPERLARGLFAAAAHAIDPGAPINTLTREQRRALVETCCRTPLPVTGDRGFTYAEVTAGGVPLSEVRLETMESRLCPGLYLCGEICDVDGRIGGYNFQWAWASGFVAGSAAGSKLRT